MEIIEARNLPDKEKIYLKKGIFGYSIVHPAKNEDGSINWSNLFFGGYGNLFKLLFVLFVIFCFIYGVKDMTKNCADMAKNPCKYTNLDCSQGIRYNEYNSQMSLSSSIINISFLASSSPYLEDVKLIPAPKS